MWLGDSLDIPEASTVAELPVLQSIIGCQSIDGVSYVAVHLLNRNLIRFERTDNSKFDSPVKISMTFTGWEEYERLKTQTSESRTVFMAMQFGDSCLNSFVDTVFRPAVAATGFELRVLTDVQSAGFIDDQLRVEIRRARMVLADITHGNKGAYWEAGSPRDLGNRNLHLP